MNLPKCGEELAAKLVEALENGATALATGEGANPLGWAAETTEALVRAIAGNRPELYRGSIIASAAALGRFGLAPRKGGPRAVAAAVHDEVLEAMGEVPAGHPLASAAVMLRDVGLDLSILPAAEPEPAGDDAGEDETAEDPAAEPEPAGEPEAPPKRGRGGRRA